MKTAVVFSAHMDDAVLGCAQFIDGRPDTTIVTVLAGYPPPESKLTSYDQLCGFNSSKDAISARRAEDAEALAYLKATPVHLDHMDSQYGAQDRTAIAADIKRIIEELEPEIVVAGLGLVHPDHMLVREAVLDAMQGLDTPLWLYEDLPARVTAPETVPAALESIRKRGWIAELGFIGTGSLANKCSALWAYSSQLQLPDFENRHCFLVPERFYLVTPKEQG